MPIPPAADQETIMSERKQGAAKVGERPDKGAAAQPPKGGQDRAGFDLGGSVDASNMESSDLPPGGPRASPGQGGTATGRASGLTDVSGSHPDGSKGGEGGSPGSGGASGSPRGKP
jgi:hypothetical protein